MIRFVKGNLFDADVEALVNTVNCVGVMGKGIAHQFQRAYPAMFRAYQRDCREGRVRVGALTTFREGGKLVINFPTKQHWRAKSRLDDIITGLSALRGLIQSKGIRSLAIPPLGCGNGGLDWPSVKSAISTELGDLTDVEMQVFEPAGTFASTVAKEPSLSLSHYVLAALAIRVRNGKVALQKAAYFFNVFAREQYFLFGHGEYGPYFVGLDAMIRQLADYRDFTKISHADLIDDGLQRKLSGTDADRLRAWMPVIEETAAFARRPPREIEALATVHAVVAQNAPVSRDALVPRFLAWSSSKAERFEAGEVLKAAEELLICRLINEGLYGFELPAGALAPYQVASRGRAASSSRRRNQR